MRLAAVLVTLALLAVPPMASGQGNGNGHRTQSNNTAPTASFTFANVPGWQDLYSFDASSSSDADGDALTFAWNFGDGHTGQGRQVSHQFLHQGEFQVALTVTDTHAATGTATRTVQYIPELAPNGEELYIWPGNFQYRRFDPSVAVDHLVSTSPCPIVLFCSPLGQDVRLSVGVGFVPTPTRATCTSDVAGSTVEACLAAASGPIYILVESTGTSSADVLLQALPENVLS